MVTLLAGAESVTMRRVSRQVQKNFRCSPALLEEIERVRGDRSLNRWLREAAVEKMVRERAGLELGYSTSVAPLGSGRREGRLTPVGVTSGPRRVTAIVSNGSRGAVVPEPIPGQTTVAEMLESATG